MMASKHLLWTLVKFFLVLQLFVAFAIMSLYGVPYQDHPGFLQTTFEPLEPTAAAVSSNGSQLPTGAEYVYNHRKWAAECPAITYKININTEQAGKENGSVADFRQAIIAAANTWSAVQNADFTLVYGGPTDATEISFNGVNEIVFMDQGPDQPSGLARYWFTDDNVIVEADIWLNDAYNWDATGAPDADEVDLQSVALHEFGHWLSLAHDTAPDSVMNATIEMGSLKRELSRNELAGIRFIYPRPPNSLCPPGPTPRSPLPSTPTSTLSATPIPPSTSRRSRTDISLNRTLYLPLIQK